MIDDAWVNNFDDLFENFGNLNVIVEYIDNDADERIQNLRILNPIEQRLNCLQRTLHKCAMTSLTPIDFLFKLYIILSKNWSDKTSSL